LGGGPGLKVDFAKLSSHLPTRGSVCAEATDARAATKHRVRTSGRIDLSNETLTGFITLPFCPMEMEQLDLLSLQLWHDDDNFSLRATA